MTCRDTAGYLRDRAATTPEPDDRAEFEAHLAACENCREFVREYDLMAAVVRAAYTAADPTRSGGLPAEALEGLMAGLDDEDEGRV